MSKPELRSTHRILWHPKNGDVKLSSIWVTVEALTANGPWVRPTGMPVIPVTWAEWAKMLTGEA